MENDSNLQLAVVEEKISSIERLTTKLDTAIEKISEVNNNVSRMLAVHEERIAKQEQVDNILFDKIDKLRDKMDSDHDSVTQRIRGLERKVWIGLGILSTVTFLLNLPFNPQKVLQSQQPSAMMDLR